MKLSLNVYTLASVFLASTVALASGYEKTNLESGRYMGIAGAATSSVAGAEAIYFNPAGLGGGNKKNQLVGDLSAVQINFSGPIADHNQTLSSSHMAPSGGIFYRNILNEQWALGVGAYVAGGNVTEYSGTSFTGRSTKADVATKLGIEEVAVGASYKVNEKLKVGFAWRGGFVQADQVGVSATTAALVVQEYRGMKGSNMMGYRLGAMYDVNEYWGLGMSYRNALPVAASGRLQVNVEASGVRYPSAETDMTVRTQLPQQLNFGTHYKFSSDWTGFFDYSWTNYGVIDRLVYEGNYSTLATGGQSLTNQFTGWSDQTVVRLAAEYKGHTMPLRFGYAYTTQVTSTNFANPTFAPPAPSHTLSLGTGHEFTETMTLDAAVDYTTYAGTVSTAEVLGASTKAGDYKANVTAVHLGLTYDF